MTTAIKRLHLEKCVAEGLVHSIDESLVDAYCGSKHARGNGGKRYRRAGGTRRRPGTCLGRLDLRVSKVRDTQKEGTQEHFRPLEDVLVFDGRRVYQEDISMIGVELATKMTYRDAWREGRLFVDDMPSPRTINRRAIEYGELIKTFNTEAVRDASLGTAFVDASMTATREKTRSHGWKRSKNIVLVTLGVDKNGDKKLVDASVNSTWNKVAKEVDAANSLDKEAVVVGDDCIELRKAFAKGRRRYQLDMIHAIRTAGYKLWKDMGKDMCLKDRRTIVKELEKLLYTLKGSVEKHLEDGDVGALRRRINWFVKRVKSLAVRLLKLGCWQTPWFLLEVSNYVVTFAWLAVEGKRVPWNSNIIERLMGEVSKRAKHRWMSWSSRGLEAILNIILVRYTSEDLYEEFKRKIMKLDVANYINCKVQVLHAGSGVNFNQS
ncbi:transposase [Candidatus Bathyarchaeota archaeon]|nr:transposase [Candidatus Bathyarchaeota archaeon]